MFAQTYRAYIWIEKGFYNFIIYTVCENIEDIKKLFSANGVKRIIAKSLSANDNSKNQIYLGGDFSALNIIPHQEILTDFKSKAGSKRDRAKAKLNFIWVNTSGQYKAPHAQLILYPKYPEVRLSGFLLGCQKAPSDVMTARVSGRVLFLGITENGQILGYAAAADSLLAKQFMTQRDLREVGVFYEVPLSATADTRAELLSTLRKIYLKHWIESKRLKADGTEMPYSALNAGGYTLEAELGVTPNSYAKPDFLGWEIKQYSVDDFEAYRAKSPVSLFTPEPTGGYYKDEGVIPFVDRYGYADKRGRPHRKNFGGIYKYGTSYNKDTQLKLSLIGYNEHKGIITDMAGGVALLDKNNEPAALWNFPSIIEHWNRKHAKAAYVPSLFRKPPPEYRYGPKVCLCEGTDFSLFLKALLKSSVYLDPAIKVIRSPENKINVKRRNQFRINHRHLSQLYNKSEVVSL